MRQFPACTVAKAAELYRACIDNKFFPHPGALIAFARKIPDPGYAEGKAMLWRDEVGRT